MKPYLAEFLGTMWLVLGGCGAAMLAANFPGVGIGLIGVSLAFGLTVLSIAYSLRPCVRSTPEPCSHDWILGQWQHRC
jgi:aquaporin Z